MKSTVRSLGILLITLMLWTGTALAEMPLSEIIGSKVGRYVLSETYAGKEFCTRVLGREISTASDYAALEARLNQPRYRRTAREFTERMNFLDERFRINRARPVGPEARISRLSAADNGILESLAGEELNISNSDGMIEFAARPTSSEYALRRMEFLNGPSPRAFPEAFPANFKTGTLQNRMAAFAAENAGRVKIVRGVKFKMEAAGRTYEGERDVVVISTKGLNETQSKALMGKYLRAVGKGTVSFPLSEGAGHLHTRLGVKDLDFLSGLSVEDYRLASSKRLEPVMALNGAEEANLRTFIDNANAESRRVLGEFGYEGVASGETHGSLTNNRPLAKCDTHNCTSWITTAHVGADGESLFEMAGASSAWNIHTNPGWWSNYLMVSAPVERVPMAIYWTAEESMTQASRTVRPGQFLEWNFGNH